MAWQQITLIAFAIVGVAGLTWIDMRFHPPGWLSWLLLLAVALPGAYGLLMWAGWTNGQALWVLPLVAAATGFRMVVDWFVEKFRTRNDD